MPANIRWDLIRGFKGLNLAPIFKELNEDPRKNNISKIYFLCKCWKKILKIKFSPFQDKNNVAWGESVSELEGQLGFWKFNTWRLMRNKVLDVRGSVHHSTIYKKKIPTRCNNILKFYYSIFVWSSTCFGRHTAHHQEPKTVLTASGFSYVEGCWTCSLWTFSGTVCLTTSTNYTSNNLPTYEKPEVASAVLGTWWWVVCRPKHVELYINME